MASKMMHQFTEGIYKGDAVSDHVFLIQRWLRDMGYISNIYATTYDHSLAGIALPLDDYRTVKEEQAIVYHHAVGSEMADRLAAIHLPQILIYHNITPPEFFKNSDPALTAQLKKGRQQLAQMRDRTKLALADSPYNEQELVNLGFKVTGVLPIVLEEESYDWPLDQDLAAKLSEKRPVLLFVGRVAPNKKQDDLINLLYFYRRIESDAQLILVGSLQNEEYRQWLVELTQSLGLPPDAVRFTGHVSQQALVTYYKSADLFISMSEHEGFGKPLVESMYLGLPIMAYASTAVPYTLGQAGLLFHQKNYVALAEVVQKLVHDQRLRDRMVQRQYNRVQDFLEPAIHRLWLSYIHSLANVKSGF